MNGAESLVRTLVSSGVEVCFSNPGTSEMHFVGALDKVDGMRCVLCLFEGVATGAADGYGRMLDRPAATLLHLGPGLGNGLANLHNAKKASTPVVNIVGDHATYHRRFDAPLTSDIETAARPFSHWVRTSSNARTVAADGAAAVAAARTAPGQIATLILPADTAWDESDGVAPPMEVRGAGRVTEDVVKACARKLGSAHRPVLLLGGAALRERSLDLAGRIAEKTGARIMSENQNTRMQLGAGRVAFDRLLYPVDDAIADLAEHDLYLLVGSKMPVAFFAYPNKKSLLAQPGAQGIQLTSPEEDPVHALEWLADELGVLNAEPKRMELELPPLGTGAVTLDALASSLVALLPEHAIVVDESATTGRRFIPRARFGRPVDWMNVKGGSIGFGLAAATGAAVACPDRKVVCLESDGSGMYTLQALWTQARENLDVTVVVFANRTYGTLIGELKNVGVTDVGQKARDMFEIDRPEIGWTHLAKGLGVPAVRVTDMDSFNKSFKQALEHKGPYLVEVMLP